MERIRITTAALCALFLSVVTSGQDANEERANKQELPKRVAQYFQWLPTDTETVIVSQRPWVVRDLQDVMKSMAEGRGDPSAVDPDRVIQFMASTFPAHLVMGLSNSDSAQLFETLKGQRVVFAMEGARHFTEPETTGAGEYEGCQLLQFEASAKDALDQFVKQWSDKASESAAHSGCQVHTATIEMYRKPQALHLVRIEEMLLIATDASYVQELLERRQSDFITDRALPDELPEWEHVNTSAPVWAVRHYREDRAEADRSSPLHTDPWTGFHDAKAVGFTFHLDPKSISSVVLHHLTNAEEVSGKIDELWSTAGPDVDVSIQRVDGVGYRASPKLNDLTSAGQFYFLLVNHLGHMMAI